MILRPGMLAVGLLVATASGAVEPPEELFFGLSGLRQRLKFDPPPATRSGAYRFELVEVDQLAGPSEALVRLVVRCTADALPAELLVLDPAVGYDARGQAVMATRVERYARPGEVWLAFWLTRPEAGRLAVFTATVAPRPALEERSVSLALDAPGRVVTIPDGPRVALAVHRRERRALAAPREAPPLYRGIEALADADDEPPPGTAYLTLRLAVLSLPEERQSWRLAGLRATAGGRTVADWRYARYLWRPDWGGWLGARGADWRSDGRSPGVGVLLETVAPDGPAAGAGLRPGDVITRLAGRPVSDAYTLAELVRARAPRTRVTGSLWRDGVQREFTVILGDKPLWPELDELDFREAWALLGGGEPDAVLSLWDWQTGPPAPLDWEPESVELLLTRTAEPQTTSFVFHDVPLTAR